VADTVEALLVLAGHGVPGDAYNVSSGTSHSVTELATMLIGTLGLSGRTQLTYTGKSWVGDAQEWRVCIRKARRCGYHPRCSLQDGLQRTVEWFYAGVEVPGVGSLGEGVEAERVPVGALT
jgi:nucleoside-diphosphate-sugar epimerase